MAKINGQYTCEVCNNIVEWFGTYESEFEMYSIQTKHEGINQIDIVAKPSIIPTIHCFEFNCPFCGKHKEIVIKDGKKIDVDNLHK